jgi:L-lysine exporter family protein LysE/ArgO
MVEIVSFFKHKLNHRIFKLINFICGLVILMYGVKLGYNLLVMR